MARRPKPRKATGKKPPRQTKALRGGVGNAPAGDSPFANLEAAAIDPEMERLAVNRPTTLDGIRRRMSVKQADSLQQVADSTLAAAMQHRASPDQGSRLYGRAFQQLTADAQERLLAALDPADADLVRQQFGQDFIDAESQAATPANPKRMSAQDRAKEAARKALEDAGIEQIPVVNLDRTLAPEPSGKTYIPELTDENNILVDSPDGWSKEQIARGYRVVQYAPANAPARAAASAPSGDSGIAASRIDLIRSRIEGQARATDTDFFFAIDEAKKAGDRQEVARLLAEQKATKQQFDEMLRDPDQIAGIARLSVEQEGAEQMARLQAAAEATSDPAYREELSRKMGLLEERIAGELAAFDSRQTSAVPDGNEQGVVDAATTVVEILSDRADEFAAGQPPRPSALQPENPNYGQTTIVYRRRPGFDPNIEVVDRITPSTFEELSPDAQRAVARGIEIMDAIDDFSQWNPDFLNTREGQRLASEMVQIYEAFPESDAFIDNPNLPQRQMPPLGDTVAPEAGRYALPPQMRISNVMGGEAREMFKLATQPERRLGRYRDVPADAPNRMAWVLLKDAEEASKRGLTVDAYRRLRQSEGQYGRRIAAAERAGDANEVARLKEAERAVRKDAKGGKASGVEVFLPPTEEISQRQNRARGGAQSNLDYGGEVEPTGQGEVAMTREREQELDRLAQAAQERQRQFRDSGTAQPVEDITQTDEYFDDLRGGVQRVPLPGSATGSPKQVQFDRNLALREGRSYIEKMQEKVFRLANQMVDADNVAVGPSGGLNIAERGGVGSSAVSPEGSAEALVRDRLGGDDPIRVRNDGTEVRDERGKASLPLDSLVPFWRGHMQFPEGGEIVTRRPNAIEVAGFLLDALDMPDPSMASRLEVHVQQAMDALEGTPPSSARAKKAAGMVFEPNANYRKQMEQDVLGRRAPGDQRPLYNEQSAIAANARAEEARAAYGDAGDGWQAAGDDFVAEQPPQAPAVTEKATDPSEVTDPTIQDAVSAFSRMRKGGGGGGASNNIAKLVGLAAATSAGGMATAGEAGELPPVEYLAMARNPRPSAAAVRSAAKRAAAKTSTPKTPPAPPPPPAPQAGGTTPPNLPSRRKRTRGKPQPADPQQQAASTTTTVTTTAPEPPKKPSEPWFPNDPLMMAGRAVVNAARPVGGKLPIPSLLALLASAPKATEDSPAVFRFNPIQGWGESMVEGFGRMMGNAPAAAPADEMPNMPSMEDLFNELPAAEPMPAPPAMPQQAPFNQGSSNNIDTLRQMLMNSRRMV